MKSYQQPYRVRTCDDISHMCTREAIYLVLIT